MNRFFYRTVVYTMVFSLIVMGVPLPLPERAPRPVRALSKALDIMDAAKAYGVQVKKVQKGTVEFAALDIAKTVDITAVDTSKTVILVSWSIGSEYMFGFLFAAEFYDSDTLYIARIDEDSAASMSWTVIEFDEGVTVQRGRSDIPAEMTTRYADLVGAVDLSKTAMFITTTCSTRSQNQNETGYPTAEFYSTTSLKFFRNDTKATVSVTWQAVSFATDVLVQSGAIDMSSTSVQIPSDLDTTVDIDKSFIYVTFTGDALANGAPSDYMTRGELTEDGTTGTCKRPTFYRAIGDGTVNIVWYIVTFSDNTDVQYATLANWTSAGPTDIGISTVDLERAFPLTSISVNAGFKNNSAINVKSELTSVTNLQLTRMDTDAAYVPWQVVELAPFTLKYPNGSESLEVGETCNIVWSTSTSSNLENIKLQWSDDGVPTWTDVTGGTAVTPSNKGFAWTVPVATAEVDTDCLLKMNNTKTGYTGYEDQSNGAFTIQSRLEVVSPNGSEEWAVSSDQDIVWKYWGNFDSPDQVVLEYAFSPYSSWNTIDTVYYDNDTGTGTSYGTNVTYDWDNIPLTAGGNDVIVRVKSNQNPTIVYDESDDVFTIQGAINITYPSGGVTGTDQWPTGYQKNITWSLDCGSSGTVDIYYSLVGNVPNVADWNPISLATVNASALSHPWTPPLGESLDGAFIWVFKTGDEPTGGKARFNLTPSIKVDQPNGNNLLRVLQDDEDSAIEWTLGGGTSISTVHAYYCKDFSTAKTWVQITGAGGTPAATGSMSWEVPNAISNDCAVKVEDFDDNTIYDESDATFTIKGWIDVYQPALNDVIDTSGSCWIRWTNKGILTGEYTIKYATDGSSFTIDVAATPADFAIGDGEYEWTTPDTTGLRLATSKIKIGKVGDADDVNGTVGFSDAFKFIGSITNVKVDGLENGTYNIGNTIDITWDAYPTGNGNLGSVEVAYDKYAGDGPDLTSSNPPGSGDEYANIIATVDAYEDVGDGTESYDWTIPDADVLYNEIRFQVRLAADWAGETPAYNVHDETSSNTAVYGSLTLTAPTGTPWLCGDDKTIYWTRQGSSMGAVNLWLSNDGGNNFTIPIETTGIVESSAGQYLWSIPTDKYGVGDCIFRDQDDGYNDQMRIRIESDDFPSQVNNELTSSFTIKSKIYSLSPSGATLQIGDKDQDIIWSTDGDIPTVNIRYDTGDAGTYSGTIASGVTNIGDGGSSTTFSTSVLPNGLSVPLSADLKIMVESAAHYFGKPAGDEVYAVTTDNDVVGMLEILLPDGSEAGPTALKANDTFLVTWKVNNGAGKTGDKDMGDLTLYYAEDGNTFSTTISSTIASSGGASYEWTPLPDPTSIPIDTCRIKLVDNDDTSGLAQDTSEAFEIRGMLYAVQTGNDIEYALEDGNGGSVYESAMSTPTIKWRYKGDVGTVAIYYDLDGGNNNYDQGPIATIDHDYNDAGAPQAVGIAYYDGWTVPDIVTQKLKFKVVSTTDADVYARSETNNEIKGNITLAAAAPGMSEGQAPRYVDVTNNIAWTVTGGISEVDIYLDTDSSDGLDYNDYTIATGYTGVSPYQWNIPSAQEADRVTVTSDKCQIKIEQGSYTGIAPQDSSDYDFAMKPRVFLADDPTPPQISTKWQVQNTESLSWSTTGDISELRLYFSVDGGNTWDPDLQATYTASDGAGTWSIPTDAVAHNNVKIKLVRYENPDEDSYVVDISPPFTIKGKISITQPASAQTYNVGVDTSTGQTGSPFRWTVTGTIGTNPGIGDVELVYNLNESGGYPDVDWQVIGTDIQADGYSATDYDFVVPSQTAPKMKMRIREKTYPYVYGESQYEHEIIGSIKFDKPTAGDPSTKNQIITMSATDEHQIHWSLDGTFSGVNVYYKENGDVSWSPLGDGYMAGSPEQTDIAHHYNPAENEVTLLDASNEILFKVEDANNTSIYAETLPADGNTVQGYLELLEPVTPDEFLVGEGITVKWKKYGNIGDIKFELWNGTEYLNNAGGSNLPDSYSSGASGETGVTYNWTVPDKISNGSICKIKISTTDALYPTLSSEHASAFTIKGAFDEIVTPKSSTIWYVGDSHEISWDATGTMSSVTIDIIIPGQGTQNIVTGYTGGSPYTWTYTGALLQKQKTEAAQIKITSGQNSGVNITSEEFTFMPRITVTTPPAPLIAQVAPTVTWTCSAPAKTTLVDILVDMDGDDDWTDAETLVLDNNGGSGIAVAASPRTTAIAIPATLSDSVKLRVRDHDTANADFVVGDTGPFRVIGEIVISKPDESCTDWKVGDTNRLIEWTVKGNIGNVKIYADYNGDGTMDETLNTYSGSTGYNSWTWEDPGDPSDEGIGDHVGNNVKIKIADADAEADASDTSDPFSIIGGFVFTKPLEGVTFHIDSLTPTFDIKWTALGSNISKVKIEYWNTEDNTGEGGWRTLYNDAVSANIDSPNHGATENSFTWKTTQNEPLPINLASLGLKFRITAAVPAQPDTELESYPVVICGDITVTSPTQGLVWTADGSTANTISWDVYGKCDNVKIEYSRDSQGTWQTLDSSYNAETGDGDANQGAWPWTIPISPSDPNDFITRVDAPTSHSSYIKVSDASAFGTYAADISPDFIVKGQLTLIAPTVGSGLNCGTNYIITWQRDGRINAVNVKYATDGINYTHNIKTDFVFADNDATQRSTALIDFKCPETPITAAYKILVEDAEYEMAGEAGTFVESAAFRVKGALTLTAPLTTATWNTNTSGHIISWDVEHGQMVKVKVLASPSGDFGVDSYLVMDNLNPFSDSVFVDGAPPVGSGSYDWTVPVSADLTDTTIFKVVQDNASFTDIETDPDDSGIMKIRGSISVNQ
ncbi:MAG: hypothetical protein ABIG55_01090, partial [Candidatus Omnitrophota bacterium]